MYSLKSDTSVKGIILLTLPISMAKLIPELNFLFNAAFLGHLGNRELALAGITGVYYLIFGAIGYGLNNALLSIMSRRAGENKRNEIFATLWHGIVLAWILAVIFAFITWLSVEPIMLWAGIEKESADIAGSFLNIRIIGLIFLYTMQMQNAFLISVQQSRYLVIIALIQSIGNIILDYVLIFGHFGFPMLGFNGAAVASVIAELIGMVTVFLVIWKMDIVKKMQIIPDFSLVFAKIALVFRIGLPLMSQFAISTGSWWLFFILVSKNYTTDEQAVSQTMRNLFGLGGVFTWAFGSSTNTVISNIIGQKRENEIFPVIKKMIIISVTGMLIMVTLLNIFPGIFFGIFGQSGDFVSIGTGTLRVVSVAMVIMCFASIWLNAVVATGRTQIVLWIEVVSILVYVIYAWLVIETLKLPIEVAWTSDTIYTICMIVPSWLYLKYGNWRKHLAY